MKDMSLDITAGEILGSSFMEIRTCSWTYFQKRCCSFNSYNNFIPFNISENVQEVFAENANKLGVS